MYPTFEKQPRGFEYPADPFPQTNVPLNTNEKQRPGQAVPHQAKVQVRNFSEDDSDDLEQFEPIHCSGIISRQFSSILQINDKGVPYHVKFDHVQKLLRNQEGFTQIDDCKSNLYQLLAALQDDVEISSEQPHNYPIDPILKWYDPIFKSSEAQNGFVNNDDLSDIINDSESEEKIKLLMT